MRFFFRGAPFALAAVAIAVAAEADLSCVPACAAPSAPAPSASAAAPSGITVGMSTSGWWNDEKNVEDMTRTAPSPVECHFEMASVNLMPWVKKILGGEGREGRRKL